MVISPAFQRGVEIAFAQWEPRRGGANSEIATLAKLKRVPSPARLAEF